MHVHNSDNEDHYDEQWRGHCVRFDEGLAMIMEALQSMSTVNFMNTCEPQEWQMS